MNFLRRHWYTVGLVVAVAAILVLIMAWGSLSVVQRLLLANFAALLLHQFEEYGWPGGEPAIMNMVLQSSSTPERYPLNQNAAMIVNVLIAYGAYLLPVFFPHLIWLGLAPMLFGIMQFLVHGIMTPIKFHRLYNPGLVAVILLHFPLGFYYLYYIQANGLVSLWDWVIGIVYLFLLAFVCVNKLTYSWLADKNSPYPFAKAEMERFSVQQKLAKRATNSLV